jgi:hypothetical protein
VLSAADPLNLVGIITPETERVPATHRNRILFRDGAAIAAAEGGRLRMLSGHRSESEMELRAALARGLRTSPAVPQAARSRSRLPALSAREISG